MALNRIYAYTEEMTEATTGYGYYFMYLYPIRREK